MDKISIICSFTGFRSSWYGADTKDFYEKVTEILADSFDNKNIIIEWDEVSNRNIINLNGDTFTIKVNPMVYPGHFYSKDDTDYKKLILTNVIDYKATKNASLIRVPCDESTMWLFGTYDDEGLFNDAQYANQPACLALEIVNMSLKMLGDYNKEAENTLIKAGKNILINSFGFKSRLDSTLNKFLEEKTVSGKLFEHTLNDLVFNKNDC